MIRVSSKAVMNFAVAITLWLSAGFSAMAQRLPFHNLNVDEGLIQSQAMCLAQDKTGNLWVGTLGGLSRYDGRNFTSYNVRNGLLSNMVMALGADTAGNIWVGNIEGLSRFNGRNFVHYKLPHPAEHSANRRQQITIVNDTVWWREAGEVYYVAGGKIKYFVTPAGAHISAMLAERSGIYVTKEDTVYHFAGNKWETIPFTLAAGQARPMVQCMYRDKDGVIWLATSSGLFKMLGNKVEQFVVNGIPLNYPAMFAITQDRTGALWIGTSSSGVIKLNGNSFQTYNKHNGLSDNSFLAMLTDAEGNVWMASDGQGIFRFSGTLFTDLDETMGLPSAQIMSIASNKRDSLFLGTYDAGLFVFKDGKVTPRPFPNGPAPTIATLLYDHAHRLWIGTRGQGLWEYHNNIFRQFSAPEHGFTSNYITHLYEDPDDRLWIGFDNGIMLHVHDSFRAVLPQVTGVTSFLAIGRDSILIATDSHLKLYAGGVVSDFETHTVADSCQVQCFTLKGRELWLGSSDNGIVRYNMDTHAARVINKNNGLRSDFIYNIVADDDGNIWAGTGYGIHKISAKGNEEPHITFYGKEQGVTGMESNLNSVLKLPDGGIWFGTTNGALHYQPHDVVVSSAPSTIVLTSVKVAGDNVIDPAYYDSTENWYGIPYHLQLPYKKNNITFTFQAITLGGADQLQYRYRMEGIDAPWSDWLSSNSVTYSALPPGKYVFHVQCTGVDGVQHAGLDYSFEIITPFQKTGWFRLAVLGACLLLGICLQFMYNSRKERRKRLRERLRAEELAKIRLRTAEDFHDEIGNKLTRINVLANVLKSKVPQTPDVTRILGQIEENAGLLYGGTKDILWSLKPSNDNLYEILMRINDFGAELFGDTEVKFTFDGVNEKWRNYRLPMDMSRNLIMIFKEALNNVLKYAAANNVSIEVILRGKDILQLQLKDDGKGFDVKNVTRGNGIQNMQTRAGRINGKLYVDSRPGKGTILSLTFKIPRNR